MNRWKRLVSEVRADVAAARDRDPAAQGVSSFEILTGWAGVQALLAHRLAHALLEAGAVTCLTKDSELEEIIRAVRSAAPRGASLV